MNVLDSLFIVWVRCSGGASGDGKDNDDDDNNDGQIQINDAIPSNHIKLSPPTLSSSTKPEVINEGQVGEAIDLQELSALTVVVLKEKLRNAGLPVSGKKAELIARLIHNNASD